MKNKLFFLLITFSSFIHSQSVIIGNQIWRSKNLNVSTFRNGDPIPQAKNDFEWENAGKKKEPAWCYYNNDSLNGVKYGKLYNWFAVNDPRGLAPIGYHVPSDAEWTKLVDFLGYSPTAGKSMKFTSGWKSYMSSGTKVCPNCVAWSAEYRRKVPCHTCKDTRYVSVPKSTKSGNGTNSSGFSGLAGGIRYPNGTFNHLGYLGYWWSTKNDTQFAESFDLIYDGDFVGSMMDFKEFGYSVRCLQD